MNKRTYPGALRILAGLLCIGSVWAHSDVTPVQGLLYSRQDIAEVQKAVKADPALQAVAEPFLKGSEFWRKVDESELLRLFPASKAVFANGYAGDPKTNGRWAPYGEGACTISHPFAVKSPVTGDIYGIQKEGDPYYDDGTGWKRPEDGKVFYFKGIWNTWIVRELHRAVNQLAMGYMLTGNEEYANRALWIFDRLATLRAGRSASDGPVDWMHNEGKGAGFFGYMGNLANMRMVESALAFDLVGKVPFAAAASPSNPGVTVFENIEKHYFGVFQKGLIATPGSLHNQATAAYAALISQSLLFGNPDGIRRGIEACYGFLDGTIDRDGEYFEVSDFYANTGRNYGGAMLNLFGNYDPNHYPNPAAFPQPEEYPHHLKFGNDPKWFQTAVLSLYRLSILSVSAQYGDSPTPRFTPEGKGGNLVYDPVNSPFIRRRASYLKLFYRQTGNPQWRALCGQLYRDVPREATLASLAGPAFLYGPSQWMAVPPPKSPVAIPQAISGNGSVAVGQKGIVILRSGEGNDQRGIFIRGGANNAHSHDDQMAITLYAKGMCLTGKFGYRFYGTPGYWGYAVQPVANTVAIVDEKPPRSDGERGRPRASMDGYLPFGPAQFVEMSNPNYMPELGLSAYGRQTWMVDLSGKESYFVDLFRIKGGKTHDYVWTAPYLDPPREDGFRLEGVAPRAEEGVWTLAALGGKDREASFNHPGRSWGERMDSNTGLLLDLGIPGETLRTYGWTPPPGNGYGFLWDVKSARTERDWSATWLLPDQEHSLKLSMLNGGGQTVVTAKAPTLRQDRPSQVVVARRHADGAPLESCFITVSQVSETSETGRWPVREARRIDLGPDAGIVVTHRDGTTDTILKSFTSPGKLAAGDTTLEGEQAFVRQNARGIVSSLMLSGGTVLKTNGISLRLPRSQWNGEVLKVTADSVKVRGVLPDKGKLRGQGVFFSSGKETPVPYSSNEFFTLEEIENAPDGASTLKFHFQSVVAHRLKVKAIDPSGTVQTYWPNELAALVNNNPKIIFRGSRVFEGHLIVGEASPAQTAHLVSYKDKNHFSVDNRDTLQTDRYYDIMATQPGDEMRIPSLAVLNRRDDGTWHVRANMNLEVSLPGESRHWALKSGDNNAAPLDADASGALHIPAALLENGEGILSPVSEPLQSSLK